MMSANLETTNAVRAVILGDSWIHGLGPERRKAFGRLVAKELGATEILDLSAVSRTVPDLVNDHLDELSQFRPHIAVMSIGGADSLVFPPWFIQRMVDRFAPSEWRGVTGLQPRALYARTRSRRVRQRAEYLSKSLVKQVSINATGGRRRVSPAEVDAGVGTVLSLLAAQGSTIILLGFGHVSGLSSPRTWKNLKRTNAVLRVRSSQVPNSIFIPTVDLVRRWEDYLPDHVHLNVSGHAKVAAGAIAELRATGVPWGSLHNRAVSTATSG